MAYYPLLFEANLHPVVWGGHRLMPWKGLGEATGTPIGESWEVSAVPSSPSIIANGRWKGRTLPQVLAEHPVELLGQAVADKYEGEMPLLVKFIDAERNLSIQVHPNDEMAQRLGGKRGKTEMWYIIDAKPEAYLYAGFKDTLTPEQYKAKVADGTITDALARHEVHRGDVFYLPAGRVHAICGGILLAEVQQSSDVTYRIFDYNRPGMDGKPRQLHTELASQALDFDVHDDYRTHYFANDHQANHCIESPYFSVRVVDVRGPFHRNLMKYDSFVVSVCLSGDCCIAIRSTGEKVTLHEGSSCFIPAAIADYDVFPLQGSAKLLDTYIDNMDRSAVGRLTRFLHLTDK